MTGTVVTKSTSIFSCNADRNHHTCLGVCVGLDKCDKLHTCSELRITTNVGDEVKNHGV